jgi:hypothetical protein
MGERNSPSLLNPAGPPKTLKIGLFNVKKGPVFLLNEAHFLLISIQ